MVSQVTQGGKDNVHIWIPSISWAMTQITRSTCHQKAVESISQAWIQRKVSPAPGIRWCGLNTDPKKHTDNQKYSEMSNVHYLFYRKSNRETGQLWCTDMSRKTKVKVKVGIQMIGLVRAPFLEMSQNRCHFLLSPVPIRSRRKYPSGPSAGHSSSNCNVITVKYNGRDDHS